MLNKESVAQAIHDLQEAGVKVTVNSVQEITGGNRAKVSALIKEVRTEGFKAPQQTPQDQFMALLRERIGPDTTDMTEGQALTQALLLAYERHADFEERIEALEAYPVTWVDEHILEVGLHQATPYTNESGRLVTPKRAKLRVVLDKEGYRVHSKVWRENAHITDECVNMPALRELVHFINGNRELNRHPILMQYVGQVFTRDRQGSGQGAQVTGWDPDAFPTK